MKNLTKRMTLIFMFLAGILTINSCSENDDAMEENDDPCADELIGEHYLFENSRNSIPYKQDLRLYFKDSGDKEVVFEAKSKTGDYPQVSFTEVTKCEFDNSVEKRYVATGEAYTYSIEEPLKSLGISFSLAVKSNFQLIDRFMVYDRLDLFMHYSKEYNCTSDRFNILINPGQLTNDIIGLFPQPIIANELTLLNKTFEEVYTDSDAKIFYNFKEGLIAFKDHSGSLWVIDKVEEIN